MSENLKDKRSPGFWPEAVACWERLPNKWFFFGLLAAWLALFEFLGSSLLGYVHTSSLFGWLNNSYHGGSQISDDGHGYLIPFLVLGLFWWKRQPLLALPLQGWWPGIFFLVAGIGLHIFGFVVQQPRFSVVGMFTGIFGLMGMAWGRAWLKESIFPFWLFIFSVPLSALLTPLTFYLRLLVTWLVAIIANLLTIHVVRQGTVLFGPDGSYQYEVAAACSGMRSLVAIFLLATIYGFITFRSPGKRLLLMALALPLSVLGNLARMLCIIFAAEIGGQATGNYVHESSLFSLIPYLPAIAGLMLAGRWLEEKAEPESK